jgi:hypothetical protein
LPCAAAFASKRDPKNTLRRDPQTDATIRSSVPMSIATQLPGLPTSGPLATAFPAEWGRLAREGVVVEFTTASGSWTGNFRRGLTRFDWVADHPNGKDVLVIAGGDLWVVAPDARTATLELSVIVGAIECRDPSGWIFDRQGIALARFGPKGMLWRTRRLSWDGFDELRIDAGQLTGRAWSPLDDGWHAFRVDVRSGRSVGGSYELDDRDRWESIAH